MIKKMLHINGVPKTVIAESDTMLADVLREQLKLTGTKVGCGQGQCGCCSVILDGKVVRSCITKMKRVEDGARVTTIEGIGTPDNLHALQMAWTVHGGAQCGFCSPGFIVSAKALLEETKSPTRKQVRDWFQKHRNACRCTGYKPLVDAVMDAAKVLRGEMTLKDLAFKLPADGRIWGTAYPRPSAVAKVTGTTDYGADLGLKMPPGTLRLALVQAKVSHAKILSIDTSNAEKMPGVAKVITHKDVKGKNRITGLITFASNKGDGWDRPILCDQKVFQFGDAIAIVAADTEENARAAAEKVNVKLEELPAYMSAPAAMAEDAIEIHPGTPNVYYEQKRAKGDDTQPLMKSAAHVVENEYYLQRQPHLTMEPDVGLAYFDDEGRLDHPLQEHRHLPAPRHDLPRPRHRAGEAADRPEPRGRHLRLQVQPDHGGAPRGGGDGHRQTGHPEIRLLPAHHLHRQALALLRQAEIRGGQEREDRRHGRRLDRGPRPLFGVR